MFSVIVFLQINIKKNTNNSLKRPQDKSTKTGSVKKEKVVKKEEEGNYVIRFLAVIILYSNKLKTCASKHIVNVPLRFWKLSQSWSLSVVDRTQAVDKDHLLIH